MSKIALAARCFTARPMLRYIGPRLLSSGKITGDGQAPLPPREEVSELVKKVASGISFLSFEILTHDTCRAGR